MQTSTVGSFSSSRAHPEQVSADTGATDRHSLYLTGGVAALVIAVLIPLQAIVFIANPPPDNVLAYFSLFQNNKLLGLLDLDFLMIVDQVLMIPVLLALYVALRRSGESAMIIATALAFLGIAAYFAAREATFGLLVLSDQYASAATEAQRAMLLAAGQALLANYSGTNFHISYNLGQFAGVVVSAIMLRDTRFGRIAPWAGIIGNIVGWGLYVPGIGIYISLLSVLGLWIWYIVVARKLWVIARSGIA